MAILLVKIAISIGYIMCHTGNEDYGFKKFTSTIDTVVMGRNTYEVVAGFDHYEKSEDFSLN